VNNKELKIDNIYLKKQNALLYNKLARILRYIDAYEIVGKTEIPLKSIKEIVSDKENN
jgi:hypothetical protein